MRLVKSLAAGAAVIGLAGCTAVGGSGSSPAVPAPKPTVTASSVPSASAQVKAGARTAAVQFYSLYASSQFARFWALLAPATRHQVSRGVWVGVHEACVTAAAGKSRAIKAVIVFGNAAIVTETIAGGSGPAEDVFDYVDGHWHYAPGDLSIYRHKSVIADVAAAKAAGLCSSWKIF